MFHKELSEFVIVSEIKMTEEESKQRASINVVKKAHKEGASPSRNESIWYMKSAVGKHKLRDSICEVIANEIFRLIIPGQPKSRLVYSEKDNRYFIISKEAKQFVSLHQYKGNISKEIINGFLKNAGFVSIVSLFLSEVALKHIGNIGIDFYSHMIKLDSGYCFAKNLHNWKNTDFTEVDLSVLPNVKTFKPYNWFDFIINENPYKSDYFNSKVSNNPYYRTEVNKGLLRILLISDSYFERFLQAYMPIEGFDKLIKDILNELRARRQMCKTAALQNASFKEFVMTDAAKEDAIQFVVNMKRFKTVGKHTIDFANLDFECADEFYKIREAVSASPVESVESMKLTHDLNVMFFESDVMAKMVDEPLQQPSLFSSSSPALFTESQSSSLSSSTSKVSSAKKRHREGEELTNGKEKVHLASKLNHHAVGH